MKERVKELINEAIEADVDTDEGYVSSLEGYAALKMKKENLDERIAKLRKDMAGIWAETKYGDGKAVLKKVHHLQVTSYYAICDAIALAAACQTYKLTLGEGVDVL